MVSLKHAWARLALGLLPSALALVVGLAIQASSFTNTPAGAAEDPPPQARPKDSVAGKARVKARQFLKGQGKAKAKADAPAKGDNGALARDVFSTLNELNSALKKEDAKSAGATAPPLPQKKITKPTLTSAEVDRLVDQFIGQSKAAPAALTTDVEFVRRVTLDIAGKLPTPDQTRAFVNNREHDKRGKLIEYLLNSPDYSTNWARYWRDVIGYHATNQNLGRIGFTELEDWLAKQFASNRPWDEITRELITAEGRNDENGAVLLTLAHEAQPVEVAGEVSRIFLGVQIQCAQCHDHPTDSWKREQFHELAAFFAGSRARRAQQAPLVFSVARQGKPRYTMPDLKDPTKQIPIAPKFFLAKNAKPLPEGLTATQRHEAIAAYITSQNNPWFAKAFVNRVWYTLMGEAFFNPIDDMGPEREGEVKAPEVLEALATQWASGGYDIRWLFRTILNTKTYQREIRSTRTAAGRTGFAANCPSRLRSDQILDSLAQVLNLPMDGSVGARGAMLKKGAAAKDLKEAVGKLKGGQGGRNPRTLFNFIYGVDPSIPNEDVLGTIPQALFLMNSPMINRSIEARPGAVLGQILATNPDNRQALNALYLRVFAREPTAKEIQTCGRYIQEAGNRREAFEDIFWSLVNSTEFITRR